MSELTKEWLLKTIAELEEERDATPGAVNEDAALALAAMKIALASLEAEPAIHRWRRVTVEPYGPYPWHYGNFIGFSKPVDGIEDEYYYAAPPAPVSVPDEVTAEDCPAFVKYDVTDADEAWARGFNACRNAMLQGADRPQNEPQNIPENIPATQFKPVADLYGLTSPTGGETSFTFDAVEARDFIDGGWSCQEYVTLERYQETLFQGAEPVTTAYKLPFDRWLLQQTGTIDVECGCVMTEVFFHWLRVAYEAGNSPVIQDGWVACVERMPSAGEQVLAYRPDAPESNDPLIKMATYVGGSAHGHGFDCYCKPTHWMPLPAAPQQED
ncbi:DUF551 domain-containing protein [Enterobacter hormaechei]|uniref:DUF551 domain-containing protein n=1 Tax=Enterobacter hormaechei TaxID=158836 RepID=UPI00301D6D49